MHIGIKVPNWGALATPDALAGVARAGEERGFGSVWVSDHVALPAAPLADYPYSGTARPPFDASTPFLDPFAALSFVAACTERVQLGTGVLVLPLRHPLAVAKQVASLDVLSGGRMVLGIGSGWLEDEFALLDQGWHDRGRRTDTAIDTLRACWTASPATLPDGTRIGIAPRPPQGSALPVLVGGHSAAAMRRAVRRGDGWYASNVTPAEFTDQVRTLRAAQDARQPPLLVGVRPGVVLPEDARATVDALADGGADFVVLDGPFASMTVETAIAWVHRIADALDLAPAAAVPVSSRRSWTECPA